MQLIVHYWLHLFAPGLVAWIFFRKDWQKVWLIMLATMLVDLYHIFSCSEMFPEEGGLALVSLDHFSHCKEIFVPNRCSIGHHPLHSHLAILIYLGFLFIPKLRIIAIGLLLHMATDFQDCLWMSH